MKPIPTNHTNGTGRIEALKQKQRELAEKLAAEVANQRKREARDNHRLYLAVGEAVVLMAAGNENFRTMIQQTLGSAVTDEKTRRVLSGKGLI